ncbi:MAG: radical SAM protein [Candidatus Paceibacterota bacterium]
MANKIGLVTPPSQSHRTAEETLGLGYLGAELRAHGYDVCIVDGWLQSLSTDEILDKLDSGTRPSVVGVSSYWSNIGQAVELLTALRKRFGDIPVICGGYGPTFHERVFLEKGFTAVVKGETEHIIVRLVDALLSGKCLELIPGVFFLKAGVLNGTDCSQPVQDLDQLEFPSRDTLQSAIQQKNFVHVCTSRGCDGHCNFCSVFSFAAMASRQRRWRQRSIRNIVDEIRSLHERFGVTHFKFVDDSFLESPRDLAWVEHFCRELARYSLQIKFRTQVRAERLNQEVVHTLKEAGWFSTSIGVENFSRAALRRMAKSASREDNILAVELLTAKKIYTQMGLILFDPFTTMDELSENLGFLQKYRWPVTKGVFTEMYAAEGTIFSRNLDRNGLLRKDPLLQNHSYWIHNPRARRAYDMLKAWHRSHSVVYDWVIDSLTAPKVLIEEDYNRVYVLFSRLQALDLDFFEKVLEHVVEKEIETDHAFVQEVVARSAETYTSVESKIEGVYRSNGLSYMAVPNPFLGQAWSGDTNESR